MSVLAYVAAFAIGVSVVCLIAYVIFWFSKKCKDFVDE